MTLFAQAHAQVQLPDYIMLVGYFVLMLGIGAYFYRYMRGMKDYFSGGNTIPWWLSGASFFMSSFSVFAFVSYSALAYRYGWVAVTIYWVTIPATIFSVVLRHQVTSRSRQATDALLEPAAEAARAGPQRDGAAKPELCPSCGEQTLAPVRGTGRLGLPATNRREPQPPESAVDLLALKICPRCGHVQGRIEKRDGLPLETSDPDR